MTVVALLVLILCALAIVLAARVATLMMLPPHFRIGREGDWYMDRWYVIPRNPWFNIYLHHTLRDDDPQALHDHPWWNMSLVLKGGYWEVMPFEPMSPRMVRYDTSPGQEKCRRMGAKQYQPPFKRVWRGPGSIVLRRATDAHRLELGRPAPSEPCTMQTARNGKPSWSLFFTGPKRRTWGFWCASGWVPFNTYIKKTADGNDVGAGCGEQG